MFFCEGDSFDSKRFSAFDSDNDDDSKNCAKTLGAGWWFSQCNGITSNLNGVYYNTSRRFSGKGYNGIYWSTWMEENLKATKMKIRQLN